MGCTTLYHCDGRLSAGIALNILLSFIINIITLHPVSETDSRPREFWQFVMPSSLFVWFLWANLFIVSSAPLPTYIGINSSGKWTQLNDNFALRSPWTMLCRKITVLILRTLRHYGNVVWVASIWPLSAFNFHNTTCTNKRSLNGL